MFSLRAYQKVFSSKWRGNWEEKTHEMSFQKYPWNSLPSLQRVAFFFFFILFFIDFFFPLLTCVDFLLSFIIYYYLLFLFIFLVLICLFSY